MNWRPHTQAPGAACAALIAIPCDRDDADDPAHLLLPAIFNWFPATGWREEATDRPLIYRDFHWMPEADLLKPLEPAQ